MTAEEKTLWDAYLTSRAISDRNRLVDRHWPLVRYAAAKVASKMPCSVIVEDLEGFGSFGLIKAVERFEPQRGYQFATFAAPRIRGAILDGIRQFDEVPRKVRHQKSELKELREKLRVVLNREPKDEEMMAALGLDADAYWRHLAGCDTRAAGSIDTQMELNDAEGRVILGRTLADLRAEDPLKEHLRLDTLRELLRGLNQVERLIVIGYYFEDLTMLAIAKSVGLSESRVSQLHSKILVRIRERIMASEMKASEANAAEMMRAKKNYNRLLTSVPV